MNYSKKIIFYFIATYLFLTPLLPLKVKLFSKSLSPADAILMLIFFLYFVYVLIYKENRQKLFTNIKAFGFDKFNIAVILLLFMMIISITYAGSKTVAIKETFRFGTFAALLYIFQTEYREEKWLTKVIKVCLFSAICVSVFGIVQYFTNFGLEAKLINKALGTKRISSTLGNPNTLAAYLVLFLFPVISAALKKKAIKIKAIYFALTILFLVNIWATGSRSAFIGIVVGALVFVLIVSFKYIMFFAAAAVVALLIKPINSRVFAIFDSHLNASRIKLWKLGLKMIENNPLLGLGNGNYVTNYNDYVKRYPNLKYEYYKDFPSHNSYIKVWSEVGLLGIISFIAIVILSLKKVYDFIKNCSNENVKIFYIGFLCSLCGFYAMNFFDNLLFVPKIALYFWVFLSVKSNP